MPITVLHTPQLDDASRTQLLETIPGELESCQGFMRLHHTQASDKNALNALRQQLSFDINTLPEGFEPAAVGLVISDMDSTFINIECIDEIADFAGKKPEVSAVTEAAMRGELDFEGSLNQRVKHLSGVALSDLERVYNERLQLNPGAEPLLAALKQKTIPFALVSGGFTFFTERLQQRYGIDYTRANTLEIEDGRLTGKVVGRIVGAEVKREYLLSLCEQLGIQPQQSVAMGDGANDLKMMAIAGLSVAYRAKPKVQAEADVAFNYVGLDGLLALLAD